jgi:outer membrane protein assembly factor BamB
MEESVWLGINRIKLPDFFPAAHYPDMTLRLSFLVPLSLFPLLSHAGDWPAFRGPSGDGISSETGVPREWGADKNILWKSPLPGASNGSPIVSNEKVFLTSAVEEGKKRTLHCFDRRNGKELWAETVEFGEAMPTHKTNQYAGTTPAADGQRVVVWHGSAGLYCYNFNGVEIWKLKLGEFRHMWGYGGSPLLHKGKVFLHAGPGKQVFMVAVDLDTGKILWKTQEPVDGNGERNTQNNYMGSWSTPVIVSPEGRELVLCSFATRVNAYDPATGKIVFSCEGIRGKKGDLCYTSPVVCGDICVAMGGFGGPAVGFKMAGEGDITATRRLWRTESAPQRIGSGVFAQGYLYMANAGPAVIECIDPNSGEALWKERAPGVAHWGSMIYVDGLLYVTDQQGSTHIFKPNPEKMEHIRSNPIGESSNSTPAFSDGQVFIRTFGHLYCIGRL